jgi:hypothetical protein
MRRFHHVLCVWVSLTSSSLSGLTRDGSREKHYAVQYFPPMHERLGQSSLYSGPALAYYLWIVIMIVDSRKNHTLFSKGQAVDRALVPFWEYTYTKN